MSLPVNASVPYSPAAPPPSVRFVEIGEERAGQRLDNFLLGLLKGVPKTRIYRLLRKGEARVNKGRAKPDYRLQTGDTVRIPPVRTAEREAATPERHLVARLDGCIVFEDARLLVVDKPTGMAVHGGSGVRLGVIETLRHLRPQARFLELAHRLDRDTSGLLMIAKHRAELRHLHANLREGAVRKTYQALLRGALPKAGQIVDAPLQKNILRGGERMVRVHREGKPARSRFRLLTDFSGRASLVQVGLDTGRTHQIRAHAAHMGQPVAGDAKYGDEAFNRALRALGLNRLFLHAWRLTIPRDEGPDLRLECPLPPPLQRILDACATGILPALQPNP